jgi:hypothetical protein
MEGCLCAAGTDATSGVEPNEATLPPWECATACANMMNSNHRSTNLNMNLNTESNRDETTRLHHNPACRSKELQLLAKSSRIPPAESQHSGVQRGHSGLRREALDLPRALLLLDKVREEGLEPVITYGRS